MITVRDLSIHCGDRSMDSVSLEVADGEIYFLLSRADRCGDPLFRVLGGMDAPAAGEVFYNGRPAADWRKAPPVVFIDRVEDVAGFETEARLGDWFDFLCRGSGLDRASIFKTLLVCNFHERNLKKKVRDLAPDVFKQAYLAACMAPDHDNIVINDFIRGAEKDFELKFNKLLLQKKNQGRAILSLGNDIFYASEIADRVGFVKKGRLLFEAGAADLKEMDIKDLYQTFLN
jgi:ABC-type Na+ transport system ATPase subunit NatA